jgi:ubiquinol-cytochrome c reductase cytochrome b subunit
MAFLTWVVLIFFAGSADRAYVFFGLSYNAQIWAYRVLVWIAPPAVYLLTRRICRELQDAERVEHAREEAEREAELAGA